MPGIVKIAFLADVGAAKVGLTQFSSDVKGTVDKAGRDWSGLKDKLKLGALAAGAAATAALADGINADAARDKLSAQLGLVGPEAAKVGKAAGDIFAGAYGDSLESVNDALKAAIQNGVVSVKASRPELKAVGQDIENYITLTGEEAGAVTRTVAQILKNKLAPNAKAAFDLLVKGVQSGVDKSDDLLDTFNEYSTQFRALGLDGPKALGLLSQGLKGGARDADTVADALKEFAIRAKDGSKTTVDGFKALGLSADKMQQVFAKGGPGAAKALDTVLDKLRAVKNPADLSTIAVDLFGTKSEDLQAALQALDPSTAVQSLGQVAGAADQVNKTLGDNAKSKITAWKRRIQVDLVNFIGDEVLPRLDDLSGWFTTNIAPKIEDFKTKVIPKAKEALGELKQLWIDNKDELGDLATNLGDLSVGITDKLIPAVKDAKGPLEAISKIDLRNTVATVGALNTLLAKGDGTVEGPTGVLAKIKSLGQIANTVNPAAKLATLAQQAVVQFGDTFVHDGTVRAKVAGWMTRNFGSIAGLLPGGALTRAGAMGAEAVAKGFGVSNPAASVSGFMVKLGRLAIQYNPVAVAQLAGRTFGTAVSTGLLGSQPTVGGRAASFAKFVGRSVINSLPFGSLFTNGLTLGTKLSDGLGSGISRGTSKVLGIVRSIPSRVVSAGGNWGGALIGAGRAVIEGLISGIRSQIPSLGGVLSGVTSYIQQHKGPLDFDRRMLKPHGAAIMGGLIGSMRSQIPKLKDLLGDVSGQIEGGLSSSPMVDLSTIGAAALGAAGTGTGTVVNNINVYAMQDGPEIGRRVKEALQDYEAFNGTSWRN